MNKKVKKDIFIGLLLITGNLIINRVVSNDIIETEEK